MWMNDYDFFSHGAAEGRKVVVWFWLFIAGGRGWDGDWGIIEYDFRSGYALCLKLWSTGVSGVA